MTWPQTLENNSYINPYKYKFRYIEIFPRKIKNFKNIDLYYIYHYNFTYNVYYTLYFEHKYWRITNIDTNNININFTYYLFPIYNNYWFSIINHEWINIYDLYNDNYLVHFLIKCKNLIDDIYKAVCNLLNQKVNKNEFDIYINNCLNIILANKLLIKL